MNELELRAASICGLCRKPFGHAGAPIFYRVTVETFIVNVAAVRRQDGFAQMMGSSELARIMGPGEDLAQSADRKTLTVCMKCCVEGETVAAVVEAEVMP